MNFLSKENNIYKHDVIFLGGYKMAQVREFIERMNKMQCPNGEIEQKVAKLVEEYHLGQKDQVAVYRETDYDTAEVEGYRIDIVNENPVSFKLLATTGAEDYVIRVIETKEIAK